MLSKFPVCILLLLAAGFNACRESEVGPSYLFTEPQVSKFPFEYLGPDTIKIIYKDSLVTDSITAYSPGHTRFLEKGKTSATSGYGAYVECMRSTFYTPDTKRYFDFRFTAYDEDFYTPTLLISDYHTRLLIPLYYIKDTTEQVIQVSTGYYNWNSVYENVMVYYSNTYGIRKIEYPKSKRSWTFIK